MGGENFANALDGENDGSPQKEERDGDSGEGFRASMAVGVSFIWGESGPAQTGPDDQGAEDVEGGLDAIGDQSVAVADHPGHDLNERHAGVQTRAD